MSPLVHLVLILVQILLASLAIAGKFVFRELPAPALVLFRVSGAATVLVALWKFLGRSRIRNTRDLLFLAFLGLLGITANQTLFLLGLQHTTAINATILVTTIPVFTVLGSILMRREPPSSLKFAGMGLAAAGTVYLIGPDRISLAPETALGNTLIVLGMVAYSTYLLLSKPMVERYGALTVTAHVMGFGALGVLPVGFITLARTPLTAVSPSTWLWIGYIIISPTILAYFLSLWALRRASSNLVAVYIYLQPIFTALVAPLVLSGERVTTRAALAGAAIFAGVAMVVWAEHRLGPRADQLLPSSE
ncbi:MAG: DMT family transporter [Gemmatimonadales bacterium]